MSRSRTKSRHASEAWRLIVRYWLGLLELKGSAAYNLTVDYDVHAIGANSEWRTNGFLFAKAEMAVKIRQVFHRMPAGSTIWLGLSAADPGCMKLLKELVPEISRLRSR